MDILIKNGEVIDGSGKKPRFKSDVGITNGKITDLDTDIPEYKAKTVIDAKGLVVAPGFVDIQNHSDSYWTLFDQPDATSLLSQGITTMVVGNCGSSLAPLSNSESIKTIQKWHNLGGINLNWTTFAEFLQAVDKKIGLNVASLVGHATLRRGLLGDAIRKSSSDEIQIMRELLKVALSQGAFGLSMGLVYAHEVNSSTEELLELAESLKLANGYLSVHLRSEGGHILESLDEVIEIAQKSGVPIKISHFKIREKKNWNHAESVIKRIEAAYHKGLNISFDVYPYDTSWNVLYTYLPKWAYEGGRNEILKVIASPIERKKIIEFLKAQEHDYKKIIIATSEGNPGFIGKSISDIAHNSGSSNHEALLNILAAVTTQAIAFDHNLSDQHVKDFMKSPLSMIATDGAGYSDFSGTNLVHPRCFGAMPKFLSWVREEKKISWEEAIRKITSQPASLLKFRDRGIIAKNNIADITVFDPNKIVDRATYEKPYQLSDGVTHVFVNGKLAFADGKVAGRFGQALRKS